MLLLEADSLTIFGLIDINERYTILYPSQHLLVYVFWGRFFSFKGLAICVFVFVLCMFVRVSLWIAICTLRMPFQI